MARATGAGDSPTLGFEEAEGVRIANEAHCRPFSSRTRREINQSSHADALGGDSGSGLRSRAASSSSCPRGPSVWRAGQSDPSRGDVPGLTSPRGGWPETRARFTSP